MTPIVDAPLLPADAANALMTGSTFAGSSSPPSGSRISSAAGAFPRLTASSSATSVCSALGIVADRAKQLAARHLDAAADLLLLAPGQQLPPRDAGEIRPNEIDLDVRNARLRRFLHLFGAELFPSSLVQPLFFIGFGLLVVQQSLWPVRSTPPFEVHASSSVQVSTGTRPNSCARRRQSSTSLFLSGSRQSMSEPRRPRGRGPRDRRVGLRLRRSGCYSSGTWTRLQLIGVQIGHHTL